MSQLKASEKKVLEAIKGYKNEELLSIFMATLTILVFAFILRYEFTAGSEADSVFIIGVLIYWVFMMTIFITLSIKEILQRKEPSIEEGKVKYLKYWLSCYKKDQRLIKKGRWFAIPILILFFLDFVFSQSLRAIHLIIFSFLGLGLVITLGYITELQRMKQIQLKIDDIEAVITELEGVIN